MAHLEADVRWPDSITDANIDRSDESFARLRAGMFPDSEIPVDPDEIGPLRAYRLRRPEARAAWQETCLPAASFFCLSAASTKRCRRVSLPPLSSASQQTCLSAAFFKKL